MQRSARTSLLKLAAVVALWVTVVMIMAGPALARVGGGQSYGGGGGSRGSDGGSGDVFFLIELLVRLVFHAPAIGIPVVIVVIVAAIHLSQNGGLHHAYSSSAAPPDDVFERRGALQLDDLRSDDPNFSETLFIDFVQLLYERFHNERANRGTSDGSPTEDGPQQGLRVLAPWFEPRLLVDAEADVRTRGITRVTDVIVGASHVSSIARGPVEVNVEVVFESNFTEWTAQGALPPLYVTERWTFRRKAGVRSKGPTDITALACPSCGSPSALKPDGSCPYCGQVVNHGDFQWVVCGSMVIQAVPRPPVELGGGGLLGGGYEAGTDLPTRYAADFAPARRAFSARNPEFQWDAFEARVRMIFLELQQAWTQKKWAKARPYETDALFNRHRYWMDMYARQGLTNRLEDIQVRQVVPVKFAQDAWFESITVRIFASMRDWTENAAGQPVSGNPKAARVFSEYWTFIRRATTHAPVAPKGDRQCPSCGAPLDVSMAGECAYCASKITSGEFDWVLSFIEQDETWRG